MRKSTALAKGAPATTRFSETRAPYELILTRIHGLVVGKTAIDQPAIIFLFVFEIQRFRVLLLQPFTGQSKPIVRFRFHGYGNGGIGNTFHPHCCPDFQWPLMTLDTRTREGFGKALVGDQVLLRKLPDQLPDIFCRRPLLSNPVSELNQAVLPPPQQAVRKGPHFGI